MLDFGKIDESCQKYTGKERDSESGLDYFGARYYGSALGRFTSPDRDWITGTRLLDPQGLNLYSYTRNRPLIAIDDDGDSTVVVTVGERQSATVDVYSNSGLPERSYPALARGQGRDRMVEKGDTPYGQYKITGTEKGRLGKAYGTAKVRLDGTEGEIVDSGRTDIRNHGGGSALTDPYAGDQPLIGTWGCVRLHNADVSDEVDVLRSEGTQGFEYIGDAMALQIMSLTHPDLRQALDQKARYTNMVFMALMQGASQQKRVDPEPDKKASHAGCLLNRDGSCAQ